MSYQREQEVAVAAVLKACDVAQATFQKLVNDETVTKKDKSPVTGSSTISLQYICSIGLRPANEVSSLDML